MYPSTLPPRRVESTGYPARNSFALLLCSAFLVAVGASKGLGVVVTALLGVAALALLGLVFAVIALTRGRIAGGILLLLGWLAFLPCLSLGGLGYGAQVSARRPPLRVTADSSAWERWVYGVELGYRRALAQRAVVQHASPSAPTTATPAVVNQAEQDFAAAVEASKRRAIRRYPELAVAGSEFNRAFVAGYNRLTTEHSSSLLLVTWPETLADECARKNACVSRR